MHITFWLENLKRRDHSKDRRKCEDNIRMGLRETGWERVDWIQVDQDSDHR